MRRGTEHRQMAICTCSTCIGEQRRASKHRSGSAGAYPGLMHQYVPVRLQIFCKCLKARDLRESPVKETSPIFPSFALSLAPLKLMGAACGAPCTDNLDAFNRACIEQIQYSRQLRHTEQEMVFTHRLEDSLKRSMRTRRWISDDGTGEELDRLSRELFLLQDLDGDGLLGEDELVQINLTIAVLHHGDGADLVKVEDAYRAMFREKLNPDGQVARLRTSHGLV